jgi:hypothetical protein
MGGSWFWLSGIPLRSGVLNHSFPFADTLTGFFQILQRCNDNSIDNDYDCYDGKNVEFSPYRPGVAQRVGRGIALLFLDRGTRWG